MSGPGGPRGDWPGRGGTAWDELVDRLRARLGELADGMLARYRAEITPALGDRSAALTGERQAAHAQLEAVLESLAQDAPFPDHALDAHRFAGVARARDRVPLPALLRGYEAGIDFLWGVSSEELAALELDPEARAELALRLGQRVIELQRRVTSAATSAYLGPAVEPVRPSAPRLPSFAELVSDPDVPDSLLKQRASAAGVPAAEAYLVALIAGAIADDLPQSLPGALRECADVLGRLAFGESRPVLGFTSEGVTVVFPVRAHITARVLAPAVEAALAGVGEHAEALLIGLGRVEEGLAGIPRSYRQASWALEAGRTEAPPPLIMTYREAIPRLMLAGRADLARDLHRVTIERLRVHDSGRGTGLVETLRTLLAEDRNLIRAASRLFVHRNTLRKRIERIEALTGMSLDRPSDVALLMLAMRADAVMGRDPNGRS